MKLGEAKKMLKRFHHQATNDGDAYFLLVFSKKEDRYARSYAGMDVLDLGIVVKEFMTATLSWCQEHQPPLLLSYGVLRDMEKTIKELKAKIENLYVGEGT